MQQEAQLSWAETARVFPINYTTCCQKNRLPGIHFCRWQYGSSFTEFDAICSEIRRNVWNNAKWRSLGRSRSLKVNDRKPVCGFLLVNNTNLIMTYLAPFPSYRGLLVKLSLLTEGACIEIPRLGWTLNSGLLKLASRTWNTTLSCGVAYNKVRYTRMTAVLGWYWTVSVRDG